ncbi:MAG: hypothetical protein LBO00_03195 [Zoogloeaceae bacterium]|jgi:hypothetical protein|nr:hypothetical protein [Zoogloeaceae bacterium]
MFNWSLYHLTLGTLFYAVLLQVTASWIAVQTLLFSGRAKNPYRLPWIALCLGLILMIPRRWQPLELALATGLYDFRQALLALLVSFAILLAVCGLSPILATQTRPPKKTPESVAN